MYMAIDNRPVWIARQDFVCGTHSRRSAQGSPRTHGTLAERRRATSQNRRVSALQYRGRTPHRPALRYCRPYRSSPRRVARYARTRMRLQICTQARRIDRQRPCARDRTTQRLGARECKRPGADNTSAPHPREPRATSSAPTLGDRPVEVYGGVAFDPAMPDERETPIAYYL